MKKITIKDIVILIVALICLGATVYMTVANMHLTAVAGVCVFGVLMLTLWQRQLVRGYEDDSYELARSRFEDKDEQINNIDPMESEEYLALEEEFNSYKRKARRKFRRMKEHIAELESQIGEM